jgi:protein TonB
MQREPKLNRTVRALAAMAAMMTAVSAFAQQESAPARLPIVGGAGKYPQGSCAGQTWPREALRYEIEGTTQVSYRLTPDGRVTDAVVAKSSGWALLDNASLKAVQTCTYSPDQVAAAQNRTLPMQFVWVLEGDRVHPGLVPGSCVAAGNIDGFQPFDRRSTDAAGVKVRFLVDGNGVPRGVKVEGRPDTALAEQVIRHVESCRFAFDPETVGMRTDTVSGRVLLR